MTRRSSRSTAAPPAWSCQAFTRRPTAARRRFPSCSVRRCSKRWPVAVPSSAPKWRACPKWWSTCRTASWFHQVIRGRSHRPSTLCAPTGLRPRRWVAPAASVCSSVSDGNRSSTAVWRRMRPREGRLLPILVLCLVAIAARLLVGVHITDDAYITMRYSRNLLAAGAMSYNPPDAVLGTSTPLWTWILALAGAARLPIEDGVGGPRVGRGSWFHRSHSHVAGRAERGGDRRSRDDCCVACVRHLRRFRHGNVTIRADGRRNCHHAEPWTDGRRRLRPRR